MRKEESTVVTSAAVTAGTIARVELPDASDASPISVFVEAAGLSADSMTVNIVTTTPDTTEWYAPGAEATGGTLSSALRKLEVVLDPASESNYALEWLLPEGSTDTVTLTISVSYTYA